MQLNKTYWEIYKQKFQESDVTIEGIVSFLKKDYGIKLLPIENPQTKNFKSYIDSQTKDIKCIVYINCYEDETNRIRPLICGVTKTGKWEVLIMILISMPMMVDIRMKYQEETS